MVDKEQLCRGIMKGMKIKRVVRVCRELEEYVHTLTRKYDEESNNSVYKDIIYQLQEILREDFDELT